MAKYRKKPVMVEAEVYKPGMEDGTKCGNPAIPKAKHCERGCCKCHNFGKEEPLYECLRVLECRQPEQETCSELRAYIDTLEGEHVITPGDYIITGVKGERYPIKADIFFATYEKAEE